MTTAVLQSVSLPKTDTRSIQDAAGPAGARAFAAPISALDSVGWVDEQTLVALKRIVATDPYLEGHYPDFTIYPGVFTIETVYQTAIVAVTGAAGTGGVDIARIDSVRFQAPLLVGDLLTATLTITPGTEPGTTSIKARCCRSDGAVCASLRLTVRQRAQRQQPPPDTIDSTGTTAAAGSSADRSPRHPQDAIALDHAQVRALLPHRNPMMHVDAVDHLEPGRRIVARKAVSAAEACYRELRPDVEQADLRYPVSLVVESLGQAGGVLWLQSALADGGAPDGTLIFGSAQDLTVHGAAYPGDVLLHEVELTGVKGDAAFMRGRTRVGDRLVLEVEHILVLLRTAGSLTP